MAGTYDVGDTVRLGVTFAVSGTNTDPGTVTLKVKDASGNTDTYTYALAQITKSATGIFYKDVALDEAGVWRYRWVGTGSAAGAEEGSLQVRHQTVS